MMFASRNIVFLNCIEYRPLVGAQQCCAPTVNCIQTRAVIVIPSVISEYPYSDMSHFLIILIYDFDKQLYWLLSVVFLKVK